MNLQALGGRQAPRAIVLAIALMTLTVLPVYSGAQTIAERHRAGPSIPR